MIRLLFCHCCLDIKCKIAYFAKLLLSVCFLDFSVITVDFSSE